MVQDTTSIAHFDSTFDIKEFLRRPIKLWHTQLVVGPNNELLEFVTSNPQKAIKSWSLPGDILKLGGKLDKIKNHQYFKANVKIKVVLNTNPFISGRFYLTYSPYENVITKSRQQKWASRAGVTAYPGVEIDAQLNNSVEIKIPFASYKESYVVTEKEEPFAELALYNIVPVMGKTDATLDMAVYAWFEDVELNIPTSKDPTGLPTAVTVERPLNMKQMERINVARKIEHLQKTQPAIYSYIMSTIGVTRTQGTMQIQAEAQQAGPISSIAGTVSGIADVVGSLPIPVVSEIANTVGWVADIVGGIGSIFGWSKPHSYNQVCPLQNVPGKFYTHVDSEDQGVSLSLSAKNELDKLSNIFPSAADEMDLAYVCANPAIKYIFDWQTSAKAGENFTTTPIGIIPVGIGSFTAMSLGKTQAEFFTNESILPVTAISGCPGDESDAHGGFIPYMAFNHKEGTSWDVFRTHVRARGQMNYFLLSTAPCEYVSQMYKYWRATMCFKISVVKTAFHTGRFEIFFDPGMYSYKDQIDDDTKSPTQALVDNIFIQPDKDYYKDIDTTNNYKHILDLTNDTEVTIRIPFVSEKLFKSTKGLNSGVSMPTPQMVADSIIGSLVIRPVSNLMCPETVSQNVKIIVWKWAEDVVLTCPVNASDADLSIYNGEVPTGTPDLYITDIPKDIVRKLPVELPVVKPGDPIKTEDKVCKTKGSMQINIGNTAEGNVVTFFSTTNIEQENMNACKNASGERIVSLRPLLRVFRNYKDIEREADQELHYTIDSQEEDDKVHPDYLSYLSYMYRFFRGGFRYKIISDGTMVETQLTEHNGTVGKLTPSHITFPNLNPMHEVSVPYYSQFRKLPISSSQDGIMKLEIKGTKDISRVRMLRAGNDDLTFGWLMGTPQLIQGNSSVTWKSIDHIQNAAETDRFPEYITGGTLFPKLKTTPK
ncbi:putative structural polyprotein [Solenopsis invicta virus 12]|nr:putative structural polyprotein [Solenopsis invicta virus 12]